MTQKIIFLDLDDTLLNRQKEVTPGNREAIRKALAAGHKVVICTGRPLSGAARLADELELNSDGCYLISFNGGILYDTFRRENVFVRSLPRRLAGPIFAEANRRGIHIQTYDENMCYVEPRNQGSEEIQWYCRRIKVPYDIIPSADDLPFDPIKILCNSLYDQEPLKGFKSWMDEQFGEELDTFFSCRQLLEIVPKGINKGNAVIQLCSQLGIPVENSIACGDAQNDLTMIRAAGLGVVMANGQDEVKAVADYITQRDCDHDGIQEVIEKFML